LDNEKKFIIDDQKTSIIFQKDINKKRKFEFDYIFKQKEDFCFISKAIKNDMYMHLDNEKNLFFMSCGQEKLGIKIYYFFTFYFLLFTLMLYYFIILFIIILFS
jgi:hypothetical protein